MMDAPSIDRLCLCNGACVRFIDIPVAYTEVLRAFLERHASAPN